MTDKVLMKGNEALAEAAVRAGCTLYFGYPITPQSEIPEYMSRRLPKIEGGAYIQAETEVSAINMVYGAAAAGRRAMTTSSSPGVSLMMEGISYLAGAELPCVVVNIMRGGPGLGNISPEQSDYFQATKGGGHGNYKMIVLAPNSVQEMADLTMDAFDLADQYRNPVMIVAEGNLGQMMEPVAFKDGTGKTFDKSKWALTGTRNHKKGHLVSSIYLDPEELENYINNVLFKKYAEMEKKEIRCEEYLMDDAQVALVAYGIVSRVSRSAVDALRAQGVKAGLIRPITVWPYPYAVIKKRAEQVKFFMVSEMSKGQMIEDVQLAVAGKKPIHFYGRVGGMIQTPDELVNEVKRYMI